jgi:hypothetical protein
LADFCLLRNAATDPNSRSRKAVIDALLPVIFRSTRLKPSGPDVYETRGYLMSWQIGWGIDRAGQIDESSPC